MTHQEATQIGAVDRYLLNEMEPETRDAFEEHYFDCQECSTELRATAAFIDAAKKEFKDHPKVKPVTNQSTAQSRFNLLWKPAVLTFALAASLLVIVYQNVVVYPHYKSEIAQLEAPAVLPTVSLIGANSRGAANPTVGIGNSKRVQLVFDIPAQDRFTRYEAALYAPSATLLGKTQISSQAAKDTVTMDAPTGTLQTGTYHLVVKGKTGEAVTDAGPPLQDYSFVLSAQ